MFVEISAERRGLVARRAPYEYSVLGTHMSMTFANTTVNAVFDV